MRGTSSSSARSLPNARNLRRRVLTGFSETPFLQAQPPIHGTRGVLPDKCAHYPQSPFRPNRGQRERTNGCVEGRAHSSIWVAGSGPCRLVDDVKADVIGLSAGLVPANGLCDGRISRSLCALFVRLRLLFKVLGVIR
jgi:hypothetical protein